MFGSPRSLSRFWDSLDSFVKAASWKFRSTAPVKAQLVPDGCDWLSQAAGPWCPKTIDVATNSANVSVYVTFDCPGFSTTMGASEAGGTSGGSPSFTLTANTKLALLRSCTLGSPGGVPLGTANGSVLFALATRVA